jgi:hypothetical protein
MTIKNNLCISNISFSLLISLNKCVCVITLINKSIFDPSYNVIIYTPTQETVLQANKHDEKIYTLANSSSIIRSVIESNHQRFESLVYVEQQTFFYHLLLLLMLRIENHLDDGICHTEQNDGTTVDV